MSYGRSMEERYRALLDRFYIDDEGVIRRRPAEVHPSVRSAVGAARHKAYVKMLNKFAHQPISGNGHGDRSVRVYKTIEMPRHLAEDALILAGPDQRKPMQVIAPEALWVNTSGRKAAAKRAPKARDRKAILKTMAVVDGVIVWRPIDETQAGYLHPALEGMADGWNKRFAGKPVAIRHTTHSGYAYIKVGSRFLRVEEVMAILEAGND